MRSFFQWLVSDGRRSDNPTVLLETPQFPTHLPTILTTADIDAICATFDLSDPLEQRNRLIIETLYGCGLRVSELITLQMSRINLKDNYLMVTGNGCLAPYAEYFCAAGYGSTRPVADNSTPEGQALNRRIEISVILKDESVLDALDKYLAIEIPEAG